MHTSHPLLATLGREIVLAAADRLSVNGVPFYVENFKAGDRPLICEMLLRAKTVGLTEDHSFELPLTQEELGDSMGFSTVHFNCTLQDLRAQGLITTAGKWMIVNDLDDLMKLAEFNPNYLHQVRRRLQVPRARAD